MPRTSSTSSSERARLSSGLLRFAPIAALVYLTNALVDPGTGRRKGAFERLAVDQLLAGHTVRRGENDRLLQALFLESTRTAVDALVLGSSRTMPLRARQLGRDTLWNASVPGARLEEIAVLYLKAARSPLAPSTVFLGLDLTHFYRAPDEPRPWFTPDLLDAERELGAALLPASERIALRWSLPFQRFRLGAFQLALSRGIPRLVQRSFYPRLADVVAAPGEETRSILRRTDGSISFPPNLPAPPAPPFVSQARHVTALDEVRLGVLQTLVARIRADGREPVLLLPPYRPGFAESNGLQPLFARVEREARVRAERWRVRLLGSFDAASCSCTRAHFRDDTHPQAGCFDRFLPGALNAAPR